MLDLAYRRGSQSASKAHRALLKTHAIQQSTCAPDVMMHEPKLIYHEHYRTREPARNSIFEYIEVFYLYPVAITAYVGILPMAQGHQRILKHTEKVLNFLY